MARITVEDCLENVGNRFELVLIAAKRARQLADGKEPQLPRDNDKDTVLALREIADGLVTADILEETPEEDLIEDLFVMPDAAEASGSADEEAGDTMEMTAADADSVAEEAKPAES